MLLTSGGMSQRAQTFQPLFVRNWEDEAKRQPVTVANFHPH
jgi:hypothetical protein